MRLELGLMLDELKPIHIQSVFIHGVGDVLHNMWLLNHSCLVLGYVKHVFGFWASIFFSYGSLTANQYGLLFIQIFCDFHSLNSL